MDNPRTPLDIAMDEAFASGKHASTWRIIETSRLGTRRVLATGFGLRAVAEAAVAGIERWSPATASSSTLSVEEVPAD